MYDRNLGQGQGPLGLRVGRLRRVGNGGQREEGETEVLVAAPLGPLALLVQPKRHGVHPGGRVVDVVGQVTLNVEVLLEYSPPEG